MPRLQCSQPRHAVDTEVVGSGRDVRPVLDLDVWDGTLCVPAAVSNMCASSSCDAICVSRPSHLRTAHTGSVGHERLQGHVCRATFLAAAIRRCMSQKDLQQVLGIKHILDALGQLSVVHGCLQGQVRRAAF